MGDKAIEKLTLVLGGARSGKSGHALAMAEGSGLKLTYLATARAQDAEMKRRIAQHQSLRSTAWRTIEEPLALADTLVRESNSNTIILVDCLTLWLSNLFAANRNRQAEVSHLLACLAELRGPVIMVSNEVGLGIVPGNALARHFRDAQGSLNQKLAQRASLVIFMAAGLPMILKAPQRTQGSSK